MKISEITNVSDSGNILPNIDQSNAVVFSDYLGSVRKTVMKVIQDNHYVYYILDDNQIAAAVVCLPLNINGIDYLQTRQVFVAEEYRNQGLAVKLYYTIKIIEKMNLVSDDEQTLGGKQLWQKLSQYFDIAVMNTNTAKIDRSINVNDVYSYESNNLVLVTETDMSFTLIPPYLRCPREASIV